MQVIHNYSLKIIVSLILILNLLLFCTPAFTQTEEEMQVLRMYYREEELVITPTRIPKPISQVAENITVITARDIEEMNAHIVSEALNRVTGLFVDFNGQDFGSTALLHIQGSEDRHVLVLIDGVTWNFLGGGNAETNSIPVKIIDRIEIIKGPASSAWGSSLGGVINIITKETGNEKPSGTISASYGERSTQDYSAGVSGKTGQVGYYLYAGHQDSDGLRDNRFFHNNSFYSKISLPIEKDVKLGFTFGYSEPKQKFLDSPSGDITSEGKFRELFATLWFDAVITRELVFDLTLHTFTQDFIQTNDVFGSGIFGHAGDMFLENIFKERTRGSTAKFVLRHDIHTAVLGADVSHGSTDQTINLGPFLQSMGLSSTLTVSPDIDRWAVFLNDTITLGKFSITPGIRYDHNSVSGPFTSPSLGLTYKAGGHTILRASAARGFTMPPLSTTSGGGFFLDPNLSLKPEKVWSYQTGIESSVTDYLWVKAILFYHDMEDAIVREPFGGGPPAFNDIFVNKGSIKRKGIELEAETVQLYNISLKAGFAYVKKKFSQDSEDTDNYLYNIVLKYDDRKSFMAQLFGHYIWWDIKNPAQNAKYSAFIFDLNLRKKIYSTEKTNTEMFLTLHNIFNGSQYTIEDQKNPGRWIEAGLRLKF